MRDERAPLAAGQGCTAVDAHEAQCATEALLEGIVVYAGDLDDRVRITGGRGQTGIGAPDVFGGAGDDDLAVVGPAPWSLDGGPGNDVVAGGAGPDRLVGGGGTDVLRGGPGGDILADGDGQAPDRDVLDGGEGLDTIDDGGRRIPSSSRSRRAEAGRPARGIT